MNRIKDVPCVDCRKQYPPHMMDFDHVRGTKKGNVSAMVSNCPRERTFHRRRNGDATCEERGFYRGSMQYPRRGSNSRLTD